jgi:hypothetical protein
MIRRVVVALALCLVVVLPAAAQTVDDIVARNIDAKGGFITGLRCPGPVREQPTGAHSSMHATGVVVPRRRAPVRGHPHRL